LGRKPLRNDSVSTKWPQKVVRYWRQTLGLGKVGTHHSSAPEDILFIGYSNATEFVVANRIVNLALG
jgi:hypothetical protein